MHYSNHLGESVVQYVRSSLGRRSLWFQKNQVCSEECPVSRQRSAIGRENAIMYGQCSFNVLKLCAAALVRCSPIVRRTYAFS